MAVTRATIDRGTAPAHFGRTISDGWSSPAEKLQTASFVFSSVPFYSVTDLGHGSAHHFNLT